jgi:hypothetical protein
MFTILAWNRGLRKRRHLLAMSIFAVALLPLAIANTSFAAITALAMRSDPGDWVGQGNSYYFDLENCDFGVGEITNTQIRFQLSPHPGTGSSFWFLTFSSTRPFTSSPPLATGQYLNATRWPFQPTGQPGLDVWGDGRGSNTLTGQFEVLELDRSNPFAIKFAVNFEQHTEGDTPGLYGQLRYNSSIPIVPEPSSLLLIVAAGGFLSGRRYRKF